MVKKNNKAGNQTKITDDKSEMNSDFKQIHDLVKLVNENNIGELVFEKENYKISLKQKNNEVVYATSAPISITPEISKAPSPATPAQIPVAAGENKNLITIKSPMIGTFYLKPSPEKPDFVSVGSTIKKGQVLCIVEAMKLFNEIESEVSGTIVKILVNNSSPIEFDQALFLVEPK